MVIPPTSIDPKSKTVRQPWPNAALGQNCPRQCSDEHGCMTTSTGWRSPEPLKYLTSLCSNSLVINSTAKAFGPDRPFLSQRTTTVYGRHGM